MKKNRFCRTVLAFALVLGLVLGAMPAAVSAQDVPESSGEGVVSEDAASVGSESGEAGEGGAAGDAGSESGGDSPAGSGDENGSKEQGDSPGETGGAIPPEGGGELPSAQEQTREPEEAATYALTVAGGEGASGSGFYEAGQAVDISAGTPPAGQRFSVWISSGGGVFGDATSAVTSFIMPGESVTLTAEFEADPNADPLLDKAKAIVEGYAWWTTWPTLSEAHNWADWFIRDRLLRDKRFSEVATKVIDSAFVAPVAGTWEDIDGTDGSYSFTVELRLGEKVQTTDVLEITLKARSVLNDVWCILFDDPDDAHRDEPVEVLVLAQRATPYNMKDYLVTRPYNVDMDRVDIAFTPVNNKTAKLTSSGLLIAKAPGMVNVKATVLNYGYTDTVTVKIVSGLQKISVNQSQTVAKKLAVKKTFTPKVSYTPKNIPLKTVQWSSDNESIAKVNAATGKVVAVSPGKAKISLTVIPYKFNNETAKAAGAFTWSYEVFVPATRVDITKQNGETVNGRTLYLARPGEEYSYYGYDEEPIERGSSIFLNAKAFTAGEERIAWSSDKKQKAVVLVRGENGNQIQIKARKAGKATITAKASGGKSVSVNIVVAAPKPIEIARADGSSAPLTLWTPGEEENPEYCPFATALIALADNAPVKWKASEKGMLYLYAPGDGRVVGVAAMKPGTVKLTATNAKGKSASINITIKRPVTNIEITNSEDYDMWEGSFVSVGESFKLKTRLNRHYYEVPNRKTGENETKHYDNPAPTTKTLVWSSSDPSVASVSSTGVVKALSPGYTYIGVSSKDNPSQETYFELQVLDAWQVAKKISIKQKSFSIHPGDITTLDVVTSPANAYCELEWYTNAPNLVGFSKSEYDDEDTGSVIDLYTDDFTRYSRAQSKKAKVTVVDRVSGKRASIYVTVSKTTKAKKYYPIVNMRVSKKVTWLQTGKSETLKLVMNEGRDWYTGKKLHAPSDKRVKWSIEEEYTWDGKRANPGSLAVIDFWSGKVTAKRPGYVKVRAEARNWYDTEYLSSFNSVTTDFTTVYCMARP